VAAGVDDSAREVTICRDERRLAERATKAIAATTAVAAISMNHFRLVGPRDAVSTGGMGEAGSAPPLALPDSGSVFARFRFLAKGD
jgi:hypothetical protein